MLFSGQSCILISLVIDQRNAKILVVIKSLLYSSTCFAHYVLIIRKTKFYYKVCGDSRPCIIQF